MKTKQIDRLWLLRAMCHVDQCKCADRGGMVDDFDACRIVSRHANAIFSKLTLEKLQDLGFAGAAEFASKSRKD